MARNLTAVLVALMLVACSTANPSEPETEGNTLTALVDGASFSAEVDFASYFNNAMGVAGIDPQAGLRLDLSVINLTAPGTYPLSFSTDPTTTFGSATFTEGTDAWTAGHGGGGGQITVSEFSGSGASGTFSFEAVAVPGGTNSGTIEVTQGHFEVTFN